MSLYSDALVNRARECNGLSYGDPSTRDAYLLHQYPGDREPERTRATPTAALLPTGRMVLTAATRQMGASQSGCLLHLRGLLAERSLDGEGLWRGRTIDLLRAPYADHVGLVEALLQEWCRQRGGGLRSYQGGERPELLPGELVVIGSGLQTHGLLVTSVDGDQVTSSDGGQGDPRNGYKPTAIMERTRTLERVGGVWTLGGRALRWGWR